MANQQGQGFEDLRNTISECTRIVRHRWRLAVIGLTVVGSIGFWCSQYLPREYLASTVFERRDDVVLQNLINRNSPYSFDHLKSTLTQDMIGSRALAKAATRAGLLSEDALGGDGALDEHERSALDGVLGKYQLHPSVKLVHSSPSLDTIALRCTANDPARAREFVAALRDSYVEDTRGRIWDILSGSKQFFEQEIARLQQTLAHAENALRQGFEDFPGMDPTDLSAVGNRLETLRLQRNSALQRKAELEAQIAAREQFLVSAPEIYVNTARLAAGPVPADPALPIVDPALGRAIENAKTRMVELVTAKRMTMEHPEVKRIVARIEALEDLRESLLAAAAEQQPTPGAPQAPQLPSETQQQWQAQRMRVELELDSLRRQLAVTTKQFEEEEERVTRYATLYDRLLDQGDELRVMVDKQGENSSELMIWQAHLAELERVLTAESGQRGTQFALIEEPQDAARPIKPRVASIFLVCSGLGLAAAALLVALSELFDRSFRSVGQVTRALGLPVLECVSVIPTPRERRKAVLSRLVWVPTLAALVSVLALTAGLAYTSVARPRLHQQAIQGVDQVLNAVGVTTLLLPEPESS